MKFLFHQYFLENLGLIKHKFPPSYFSLLWMYLEIPLFVFMDSEPLKTWNKSSQGKGSQPEQWKAIVAKEFGEFEIVIATASAHF